MLYGRPQDAAIDTRIVNGKLYIIDFHTSRRLSLGPGCQPPIVLPPSQVKKPPGVTILDPYSFDIYASGKLMQYILEVCATHDCYQTLLTIRHSSQACKDLIFLGYLADMRSG